MLKKIAMSPTARVLLSLTTLAAGTGLGAVYWPSPLGLACALIALFLLLPLTLVLAVDASRALKLRTAAPGSVIGPLALSAPLGLLALAALALGVGCAVFVASRWPVESPRILTGCAILGAMFVGFGVHLLRVLWPRKRRGFGP